MTATTPLTPGPQPVAGAYDPGRGHEIQAFIPRAGEAFSLPPGVPKHAAVELLAETLRARGATETEIAVFRHIAAPAPSAPERAARGRVAGIIRPDVLRLLDGPGLMELASADAALYLGAMDWRRAATHICRERGIHPTAWEEAVGVMTEAIAFIALLVLDRNRFHPDRPVASPGGVLRAMTGLARDGRLDLSRSVLGILARSRRGEQPRDRPPGPRPGA